MYQTICSKFRKEEGGRKPIVSGTRLDILWPSSQLILQSPHKIRYPSPHSIDKKTEAQRVKITQLASITHKTSLQVVCHSLPYPLKKNM